MTLTTAQQIRLRISDLPTLEDRTYYGDGIASTFLLPHRNLTTASAYVPIGGTAWSATGVTFSTSGSVAFSATISANSAFRVTYTYSVFSDDEIDHFHTAGGSVAGAALEAVRSLMFDGLRRAYWMGSDGASFDDRGAQTHLRDMEKQIQAELERDGAFNGSMPSWSLNQGDW